MAAVLESLCRKDASGILEVDGNPAGAIYLDRGRITFARSSWVPDLTARLCGALRPSPELRNFLRGSDQAESNSGTLLVRRGYMSENDLRSILRSAIIDALIVLTMPLTGESSVLDIRFEASSAHWAGSLLQLSLETVQPDVTRRAAEMSSAGIAHTAPVALSDLDRPSAVLTRTQWAIASRVDGTLSPRDLARQSGLSLYETVTSLGALIRRGLCAPTALESPAAVRPAPGATITSVPTSTVPATPLPPDVLSRLTARATAPAARRPASATPAAASFSGTASPTVTPGPAVPAARPNWADAPTPAGRTPWANSAAPDPADQPSAPAWGEQAGDHATHVPQAPRPARGAHRADRPARPETPRRPAHEASGAEAPGPPASLPPRRRSPSLPQRQPVLPQRRPGRVLAGAPPVATGSRSYTAIDPRPQTATQPFPALAEDWRQPASCDRTSEPAHLPDHPSAPLPATPPAPARSGGGAESESFAPAAPDLLRRVLDGLRRLG